MEADVGALGKPALELLLEVKLAQERAARLEARLQVALQPLDDALRLRVVRLEEAPAEPELAAESGEGLGRAALAGVQGALAVPDERLRQRAEGDETAPDPVQQVGRLLGEDEAAGAGARVGQAGDDDVAAAGLAAIDRDLLRRLPEIELAQLARPVGRALVGPRRRSKQRPDLAQVVVEDRLAALVAELGQPLAHDRPRQARVLAQQPVDLLPERLELRRPHRPPVARRLARTQHPANGVAAVAAAADDLLDREPLDEIQATDLSPLLHPDHDLLLARIY